ncbi:Hypothetical predicted protein [Octopus vulgaris]|uniref:Uncharacterized protein n=1 Tax=Octopus vulgaris TaxID=6645 RepID=A0AA36F5L3_OCTVU|nr:Hypothetical predicted protein [Octopus vulgaris]
MKRDRRKEVKDLAASYKKFDDDVARMSTKFKGDNEQNLENFNIIYWEGEKSCGLETTSNGESSVKDGSSRRERQIREEKKKHFANYREYDTLNPTIVIYISKDCS